MKFDKCTLFYFNYFYIPLIYFIFALFSGLDVLVRTPFGHYCPLRHLLTDLATAVSCCRGRYSSCLYPRGGYSAVPGDRIVEVQSSVGVRWCVTVPWCGGALKQFNHTCHWSLVNVSVSYSYIVPLPQCVQCAHCVSETPYQHVKICQNRGKCSGQGTSLYLYPCPSVPSIPVSRQKHVNNMSKTCQNKSTKCSGQGTDLYLYPYPSMPTFLLLLVYNISQYVINRSI